MPKLIALFLGLTLTFGSLQAASIPSSCWSASCCSYFAGHVWNESSNRCILTDQSVSSRDNHQQCQEIVDETARQACLTNNVRTINDYQAGSSATVGDSVNHSIRTDDLSIATGVGNAALSVYGLAWILSGRHKNTLSLSDAKNPPATTKSESTEKQSSGCQAPSWRQMKLASTVLALGSFSSFLYATTKSKKLRTQHEEAQAITVGLKSTDRIDTLDLSEEEGQAADSNAIDLDSELRALSAFAGEQGIIKKALTMKAGAFGLSAVLFASAAVFAAMENNPATNAAYQCFTSSIPNSHRSPFGMDFSNSQSLIAQLQQSSSPSDSLILFDEWSQLQAGAIHSPTLEQYSLYQKNPLKLESSLLSFLNHTLEKLVMSGSEFFFPSALASPTYNLSSNLSESCLSGEATFRGGDYRRADLENKKGTPLTGLSPQEQEKLCQAYHDRRNSWALRNWSEMIEPGIQAMAFTRPLSKTPQGRLAVSIMAGSLAGVVSSFSFHQANKATQRYNALIASRSNLTSSTLGYQCSTSDRDNMSNPGCYCYTSSGEENTARTLSETCHQEWGWKVRQFGSNNYDQYMDAGKGCMNQNTGAFDPQCQCRLTNSCMKVSWNSKFNGAFSGLSWESMMKQAQGLLSGNTSFASLDPSSFQKQAARFGKRALQAQAKVNKARVQQGKKPLNFAGLEKKIAQASLAKLGQSTGANFAASGSGMGSFASGLSAKSQEKLAQVAKKAGIKDFKYTSFAGKTAAAKKTGGMDDLFGSFDDSASSDESLVIDEAMQKDFNYGDSNINTRTQDNIWKVLAKTYQTVGMKRLFHDS